MATESDTKSKTETETALAKEAEEEQRKAEEPKDAAPEAEEPESGKNEAADDADDDDADADADDADLAAEAEADAAPAKSASSWGFGAGAVVSAGLGLASVMGTPLSEMFRERKQLIGQIESSSQQGGGGDAVNAVYGAPWHATAMINGIFALLAVVVGGVLLAALANRSGTRSWVKAVCAGGLVLGVIGLLVAGGMYFDLFASQPDAPTPQPQPQMPSQ
ncbi:hypothetical protein [Streptomyces sp. NPDC048172]|uniref:hypothetical protein n=1 Tax=Streptomyces sp. NPDC048172 TaxID=3365505 RepID=UPI00371E05F1